MEWLRNWSWRLAILALPWQTRLIFTDASIYVSWIFLILAIVVAWQTRRSTPKPTPRRNLIWITLFGLILTSVFTSFPTGTWQWWVQVLLLGMFAWSIVVSKINSREFLSWCVIALVPHALLVVHQAVVQQVIGTKWLGIATQLPETRGVAVVEAGGIRHLRAYGGMPYPNIMGGWLAFGLPVSVWLAVTSTNRKKQIALSTIGVLFTLALILTHSRSAWVACALLFVMLAWHHRKVFSLKFTLRKTPLLLILVSLLAALFWQWPLLMTRVTGEGRLETRSVNERVSAVHAGLTVFRDHPWFGVGRNAFNVAYKEYPIPHNVPLLMLVETGLVGVLVTILLFVLLYRSIPIDKRGLALIGLPLAVILTVDHYLWSYWSGQTLLALALVWVVLDNNTIDKTQKIG